MTQLAVSDELASTLLAKAARDGCTPEALIQSTLVQRENDEALVESLLTPEIEQRILAEMKYGSARSMDSEEVDLIFNKLFRDLEAK